VLSLVFVPAVFTVMDDLNRILGGVFGRYIGARDERAPDHRRRIAQQATPQLSLPGLTRQSRSCRGLWMPDQPSPLDCLF